MPECQCVSKCPFFLDKMEEMPALANMMKTRYCHGEHLKCARWTVRTALGAENVPKDLYPNQMERAQQLISRSELER